MKTQKIKRYRLSVSRIFPATHPRKGDRTEFVCKILRSLNLQPLERNNHFYRCANECGTSCSRMLLDKKLHTCRANYDLWAKRMAEVQAGRAVIELCYWSEKPYRSKQVVFATLDKDSGCGVQKVEWWSVSNFWAVYTTMPDDDCGSQDFYSEVETKTLAKNDGLSLDDFKSWFKGYDLSKPMAIIQFTNFRY